MPAPTANPPDGATHGPAPAERRRRQRLLEHRLPDRERLQRLRPEQLRLHRLRHQRLLRTGSGSGHVWFGGLYWLFMERDNPNTQKLTVRVDHNTATDPYYPQANITVLDTRPDRFRLPERRGSSLRQHVQHRQRVRRRGCGNGYGYRVRLRHGCGCPQDNYAWEVAWWGLDEDNQSSHLLRPAIGSTTFACTAWSTSPASNTTTAPSGGR